MEHVRGLRRWCRARLKAQSRDRSRGAVAVEAALITPLIMLLLFGIIEFGFVFKNSLGVASSVRAGARVASAEPREASFAQDAANAVVREGSALEVDRIEEIWVYDADPRKGYPQQTKSFDNCTVCVKFKVTNSSGGAVATAFYNAWNANTQNACVADPNHDYVGVYIKYRNPGITGLIFDQIMLTDQSVMSLEPMTSDAACR
jgi:hypothetical protein